jgi:hypothetical protein
MNKVLICLLLMISCAQAQTAMTEQPATREDVLRLFQTLRIREQCEGMQKSMMAQWKPMLDETFQKYNRELPPEAAAQLQASIEKSMQRATTVYPVEEILEDFLPAYQKNLTKADINAIVGFYSSPAGQRLLDKTPKITEDGMAIIMPKMHQRIMQVMEEMQKDIEAFVKRSQLPASAPATKKN